MISAGTVFTNDRFPRATTPNLKELRPSEPDEDTLPTLVKEGATINCHSIGKVGAGMHGIGVPDDLNAFEASPVADKAVKNLPSPNEGRRS